MMMMLLVEAAAYTWFLTCSEALRRVGILIGGERMGFISCGVDEGDVSR